MVSMFCPFGCRTLNMVHIKDRLSRPVMGARGLDHLTVMEVSSTSSTSWLVGASGAAEKKDMRSGWINYTWPCFFKKLHQRENLLFSCLPVVWEVVRIRLESPSSVSSYTLTVYFLPGRSSFRFTEVAVRGRSMNCKLTKHLKHCFYTIYNTIEVLGIWNQCCFLILIYLV